MLVGVVDDQAHPGRSLARSGHDPDTLYRSLESYFRRADCGTLGTEQITPPLLEPNALRHGGGLRERGKSCPRYHFKKNASADLRGKR